ncbi:aspartyl-phosphate phosphatase Spo0E family protein [Heyndrickxia acidicola]|uniref:Aspartyl-phosphate phosphatase Spo0E family protein n=1 Tax=Heyndrickxia acidicola TaxID=209389 RepID=A0ABU6MDE1_9BACI|nr:aspartyl-phosphate phosphatase Spo0E family protein [Heyndrickxia acidicola]MED1202319.1 aspartyl-phosphate phosphatase Spo0E family protein [Heyndrickxia acidicola]
MLKILLPKDLVDEIEQLRHSMMVLGLQKGLNDPETIKTSQELDKLINLTLRNGLEAS